MKNDIKPIWEVEENKKGGCFSYKITTCYIYELWKKMSYMLIGNSMINDNIIVKNINGISISPKRNFCILKIWNNDYKKCDKALLSNSIPNLNFSECMYKCHNDNIANDQNKIKKQHTHKNVNRGFGNNAFMKRKGK